MFGIEGSKLLRAFYLRPILPFAIEFLLLAPLTLTTDIPRMTSLYVLIFPWILIIFAALNMPFLFLAFKSFKVDMPTRRNHALEHATILILRASGHQHLAGHASANGFRLSGGPSAKEIRTAFDIVRQQLADDKPIEYISARCGSNRLLALGFALTLLFAVTLVSMLLHPPLIARAIGLASVVIAFTVMRHFVGNWFQKRLFMAIDFRTVSLRDVRKVRTRIWDKSPTYFVETIIHGV